MGTIRFTLHADEKIRVLRNFGFSVTKTDIENAVLNPVVKVEHAGQTRVLKPIDAKYALRVVCEKRGNEIVVITFYPVKRDRYGV